MEILTLLFFVLLPIFSLVFAHPQPDFCPSSLCNSIDINYPFKQSRQLARNNCSYVDLSCNNDADDPAHSAAPILNLPEFGDLFVRYIAFYDRHIRLYDPGKCLMSRLMNRDLNFSSSPPLIKPIYYENYTFFMCPANKEIGHYYATPIDCLSNSTNFTVVASSSRGITLGSSASFGCETIGSWVLPVLWPGQFDYDGGNGDLYLTWDDTKCGACQENNTSADAKSFWIRYATSSVFMLSVVAAGAGVVACLPCLVRQGAAQGELNGADMLELGRATVGAEAGPQQGGLDESKINTCTELVVVGERRSNFEPDSSSHTCVICLDGYGAEDVVRSIAVCEHTFHADCIELWLRKSTTCPVCRTTLAKIGS